MTRLLRLAYDGTTLSGCPPVAGRRTVVGVVREALARLGIAADVECLSRTDAGVHARGQVAVVTGVDGVSLDRLVAALDRHLPPDVRCGGAADVDAVPRVVDKTYRYVLDLTPGGDPFLARTSWRVRVDPTLLGPLAAELPGRRDLSAFRRRGETREVLVRRIDAAAWTVDAGVARFDIRGEGFPYRGVRSLVGAMVAVARGSAEASAFRAVLGGAANGLAQQQAPARGLCLDAITLDPPPAWTAPRVTASSGPGSGSSSR